MNIHKFQEFKFQNRKISMISCHDYWQSCLISKSDVDCILVGDSLAMLEYGHSSTLTATMDMMVLHTEAVVRGAPNKFVIADMPFLSYRTSRQDTVLNAGRLMKVGAKAIKIEGADGNLETVSYLAETGIPVMGHLGLTPQLINQLGGLKVQARSEAAALKLVKDAKALEQAGCFSLVLECVPSSIAKQIASELSVPVVGIGAGMDVDGQVLVFQDMMGFNDGFKPKFLKVYAKGMDLVLTALNQYHYEVCHQDFPSKDESYE